MSRRVSGDYVSPFRITKADIEPLIGRLEVGSKIGIIKR